MHFRVFILLAALALMPADALAQRQEPLRWIERPSGKTFMDHYPPTALAQGVAGRVLLDCAVALDTTVACTIAEETPLGWGFAAAAQAIAQTFRIAPAERGGRPIADGRIRVPLRFFVAEPALNTWYAQVYDSVPEAARVDLPIWEQAPNGEAVASAYPQAARVQGLVGRAVLGCLINADRTLDCRIENEAPQGLGFGAAAMQLAPGFVVAENQSDFIQAHAGRRIYLPVNFGSTPDLTPLGTFYSGMAPFSIRVTPPADVEPLGATALVRCTMRTPLPPTCMVERQNPPDHPVVVGLLAALQSPDGGVGFVPGDEIVIEIDF